MKPFLYKIKNTLKRVFICSYTGHRFVSSRNNLRLFCCARCGVIDPRLKRVIPTVRARD